MANRKPTERTAGKYRKAGIRALALVGAIAVLACDRFNAARIFVNVPEETTAESLERSFLRTFDAHKVACWRVSENAEAFHHFDRSQWSFVACVEQESRTWMNFGRSADLIFVDMHLTSDGMRPEPKRFGALRSEIVTSLSAVVGSERVEILDGFLEVHSEPIDEAIRRRGGEGVSKPEAPLEPE